MGSELSLLDLVLHASFVVQFVLLILVLASIVSWTMIFDRALVLARRPARRRSSSAASGPAGISAPSIVTWARTTSP